MTAPVKDALKTQRPGKELANQLSVTDHHDHNKSHDKRRMREVSHRHAVMMYYFNGARTTAEALSSHWLWTAFMNVVKRTTETTPSTGEF